MNCILKVGYDVSDPIEGAVKLRTLPWNPFTGFIGYCRDNGTRIHTGFDYVASDRVAAIAVQTGEIVQIRFGRRNDTFSCPFRDAFRADKKSVFLYTVCKDCPKNSGCYGVQVWLKITHGNKVYYALYSHLSQLSDKITNEITNTDRLKTSNTLGNLSISVKCRDKIGKCGSTGLAHEMLTGKNYKDQNNQEHLHFECRLSIEKSHNKLISPNELVKTKFYVTDIETEFEDIDIIGLHLGNVDGKLRAVYEIKEWLNTINSKKRQFEEEMEKKYGQQAWKLKSRDDEVRNAEWKDFKEKEFDIFRRKKQWEDFTRKYKIEKDSIC
jgi:murein DD-endopeptidase MepM/ murein hydrolase activator NlpD